MNRKMYRLKKALLFFLAFVFILALAAAALFSPTAVKAKRNYTDKANEGKWEKASAADWMANVDGALSLSEISLPGSHDSATEYVTLPLIGRCQDASVSEQLNMGVRVLDIRLNTHDDGSGGVTLTLSHGSLDCKEAPRLTAGSLTFDSILADCRIFLKKHPTETVLMLLKHENGEGTARQVEDALLKSVGDTADLYTEDRDPSLDEVRGKIVLARRYGEGESGLLGLNFCWQDQGGQGVAGMPYVTMNVNDKLKLCVQDRYEYKTQDKWNAVVYCISHSQAGKGTVMLNYLSTKGVGSFGFPTKYAAVMNRWFIENELLSGADYGWVMFDFVSEGLARHVFATNTYVAS